jgi:hypothetical protein
VTARGQFNTLNVVASRSISKDNAQELNFDDLIAIGTNEEILFYLKSKNIVSNQKGFDFKKIGHLLIERQFFDGAIAILREREIYSLFVW